MADATEFVLAGPAQVLWGPAGAEVELGKQHGPLTIRIREEAFDVSFNETGVNRWDAITVGKTVEVEADFANLSWDLLLALMPTEVAIYGGGVTTPTEAPSDQALSLNVGLGTSHRENAQQLVVKPYSEGAPDTNPETWFVFPLAYPRVDAEIVHSYDAQKVVHVVFEIFPLSQDTPRLMYMGNSAALPS